MARTGPVDTSYKKSALQTQAISKPVVLRLPPAHPRQYELINAFETHNCRFVTGACGTKFGKTVGAAILIVKRAWNRPGSLNWWVAPTYGQSENAFEQIGRILPPGSFKPYKADLKYEILRPDGGVHSTIVFKSGENPDYLRGFGVHFFVVDEGARMPWQSFLSIMTTVTQTMGEGLIISTPHARNWFYDVYQRGEKFYEDGSPKYGPDEPDPWPGWYSIRMPTWTNPHVPLQSIRDMKSNLPEDVFRQEVAAQFLLDSAGVFRGTKDCIKGVLQEPNSGESYVLGVDLARLKDYTVLTAMSRRQKHLVYFERFNKIDWTVQYHRIIETARRYNHAQVIMDSTGLGDPIVQQIQSAGVNVVPYHISGTTAKQQLIDKLRVNIEQAKISFPLIPVLKKELESYEYTISTNGTVKFSAPSGQHDDTVVSLALANWGVDQEPWVYKYSNLRGV